MLHLTPRPKKKHQPDALISVSPVSANIVVYTRLIDGQQLFACGAFLIAYMCSASWSCQLVSIAVFMRGKFQPCLDVLRRVTFHCLGAGSTGTASVKPLVIKFASVS